MSKILIIGCGSIASALIPLLKSDSEFCEYEISIVSPEVDSPHQLIAFGIDHRCVWLTEDNYDEVLSEFNLQPMDIVLNLAVFVDSISIIKWCDPRGVLYLDTCIEPWRYGDTDTNAGARINALSIESRPTSVIAHGANPGLISHILKYALEDLSGVPFYRGVARDIGVHRIQISEHDTQYSDDELTGFCNTWSVNGFISEGFQRAEIGGWSDSGSSCVIGNTGIYRTNGFDTGSVTRTPLSSDYVDSFCISHHEASSIADLLTVDSYSPIVYYSYRPCIHAIKSIVDKDFRVGKVLKNELAGGSDALGVLIQMKTGEQYWYGSVVSLEFAREVLPENNATSLQVVAGIIGAMRYMVQYPSLGVIEAEDIPHKQILADAVKIIGELTIEKFS